MGALEAIFDTAFESISSSPPFQWSVKLFPEDGEEGEQSPDNHVGAKLIATIPEEYPECLPLLEVQILKGLAEEQRKILLALSNEEAKANEGMSAIFSICETLRSWLADNNVKGLDDVSMHAQMMRKMQEVEKNKINTQQIFEASKKEDQMTAVELEDIAVHRRRTEGTPVNADSFKIWKTKFEIELAEKALEVAAIESEREKTTTRKKGNTSLKIKEDEQHASRLTGFDQFSSKTGILNLEAIEKAAEEAGNVEGESSLNLDMAELEVDEGLFDDEEDLDDLDFESDEEESDIDE